MNINFFTQFIEEANPQDFNQGQFHHQVVLRFPNGLGCSIISQPVLGSRRDDPNHFEVAVIRWTSEGKWDFIGNPTGWNTGQDVLSILNQTFES